MTCFAVISISWWTHDIRLIRAQCTNCYVLLSSQADNTTSPIRIWARLLSSTKQRYDPTQQKCLATGYVLPLRPYLKGQRYSIQTDHDALERTFNLAASAEQLTRWRLHLLKFHYDVIHRAEIKHQTFDSILRPQYRVGALSITGKDESPLESKSPLLAIDHVVISNTSLSMEHSNVRHIANIEITKTTMYKPTYNPPTLVKPIRS